jgi:hypothetical protein
MPSWWVGISRLAVVSVAAKGAGADREADHICDRGWQP